MMRDATAEAIVLNLDPNAAKKKKKKIHHLQPLTEEKKSKPVVMPKISGNYASDVLKDLAEREQNNER